MHFSTAIVPARPGHPKDKALVENGVKLLMRYHRFRYRRSRLTSQVNQSLEDCVKRINDRRHTRFGGSRRKRFEALESAALKPLPQMDLDGGEWKDATLQPDCYVSVDGDYYSAPHIHRHKKLRFKITENQFEIFLDLTRLAVHPRSRHKAGRRIRIDDHFPPNTSDPDLHEFCAPCHGVVSDAKKGPLAISTEGPKSSTPTCMRAIVAT